MKETFQHLTLRNVPVTLTVTVTGEGVVFYDTELEQDRKAFAGLLTDACTVYVTPYTGPVWASVNPHDVLTGALNDATLYGSFPERSEFLYNMGWDMTELEKGLEVFEASRRAYQFFKAAGLTLADMYNFLNALDPS